VKQHGNYKRILFLIGISLLGIVTMVWAQEGAQPKPPRFFEIWLLPRVWMSAIFALLGMVILSRSWVKRNLRSAALAIIFFTFAILWALPLGNFARGMGVHPSPMCITSKPFLFLNAGRGIPIFFISLFVSIAILSIIGNKLFCGWACPIGALQELVHRIKVPKVTLPFKITNTIRVGLYAVFIIVVFTAGIETYAYFNPFESLHWGFEAYGLVVLGAVMVAGLFIFRPFCYILCPLGLWTWLFEQISIVRVKVDKSSCTECNKCVDDSYCPAVPVILELRRFRPDCHACGRCIEICPEDALKFKR
jgi:polyferredoxin